MAVAARPRLVATDLDGTLLDTDGRISPRTRRTLQHLDATGVHVVFVTGRPLRWMTSLLPAVGAHGLAVLSNGALVWNVADSRPWTVRPLTTEATVEVGERIRAAVPGTSFAVESMSGIGAEPGFVEHHPMPDGSRRGTLSTLADEPALKLLALHDELTPLEFWRRAEAVVGDSAVITWSSTSALLEISAPGVTKASGVELVCRDLGIGAVEVVAFGDMPNDLPLLSWAGTAYAMANAHESVRAATSLLAPAHHEDGVALTLAEIYGLAGIYGVDEFYGVDDE